MEKEENLHNRKTGKMGEDIACNFLIENGYEIIEKNYVSQKVEIDIICRKNKLWVFVEVKCRYNALVQPEMAVNFNKQKHIARAASTFLYRYNIVAPIRFDIIAINFLKGKTDIAHFEDAFYPVYFK